jgi:hypothetical protein
MAVCAIEPVWRVSDRVNDGDFGARLVEGNGVKLVWAPAGPGWPLQIGAAREDKMMVWTEAAQRCQHLNEDGLTLADSPHNIWRLPTVDEAVRAMARHGKNAGGVWYAEKAVATYQIKPDKETPFRSFTRPVLFAGSRFPSSDMLALRPAIVKTIHIGVSTDASGTPAFAANSDPAVRCCLDTSLR